jgi:hypothetical protein
VKLGIEWSWRLARVHRASVRGDKRAAVLSWLRGIRR